MKRFQSVVSILLVLCFMTGIAAVSPSALTAKATAGSAAQESNGGTAVTGAGQDSSATGDTTGTSNGYRYSISDGQATITGYTGSAAALEIPASVNGVAVTAIGASAFQDNRTITSAAIPDSVQKIGASAFKGCSSLTHATIGGGVTAAEAEIFSDCTALAMATIAEGTTVIGKKQFYNCTALSYVAIPESVLRIGSVKADDSGLKDGYVFYRHPSSLTVYGKNGSFAEQFAKANGIPFNAPEPIIYPTSVSLNKTKLSLNIGGSALLTATVTPSNATGKAVTWSSSNTSVAAVSNGKVTAKAKGSAKITVKTANGKTAVCTVTVSSESQAAAPEITALTCTEKGVTIKWKAVNGASFYKVYYKNAKGNWSGFKNTVSGTSMCDTNVKYGRKETYTVRAFDSSSRPLSDYNRSGCSVVYRLPTPKITSLVSNENGISIRWDPVPGASTYCVYSLSAKGVWKRLSGDVKGTAKLDKNVKYRRKQTYTVRVVNKKGKCISGYHAAGWSTTYGVTAPQVTSLTSTESGVRIKWKPLSGISTYRVYYQTPDGWKNFKYDVQGTSMRDTSVSYGRKETYTVRAVNKKGECISGYHAAGWSTTYGVATPQITSLISDEKGINIKWKPVEGVSTYRVYYKTSGGWKNFKNDVKGTSMRDISVKYGRKETYTVRAVSKKGKCISGYLAAGKSAVYGVAAPQITSLTSDEKGIVIKWKPVEGVSTYRLYYLTSGGWKNFKNDVKGTSMRDTGALYGNKETYTIRAVNTKGAVISECRAEGWSAVYGVKTPLITGLKSTAQGVKITWAPVAGVSSYRVHYLGADGKWKSFDAAVKGTVMLDKNVVPHQKKTYAVSALNVKGAEISSFYSGGWSITYEKP